MKEISSSHLYLNFVLVCAIGAIVGVGAGWNSHPLFRIFTAVALIGPGILVNRSFLRIPLTFAILLAPLTSALPIIIIGSGMYLFWELSLPYMVFLLALPLIIALFIIRKNTVPPPSTIVRAARKYQAIIFLLYLIFIASFFALIVLSRTQDAMLGPWDGISPLPFLFYFLSTLILVTLFCSSRINVLHLASLCIHFFASFSVALIRFPLTFGFDPLIHHAAERLVLEHGTVVPKTLYYIGQYTTVPFLARIFDLPVETIHQFFLPILLSLSIPSVSLFFFSHFPVHRPAFLTLSFLLIPFPHLIMTTPWGLAYGTTFLTILSSGIASISRAWQWSFVSILLTLFTIAFHPLAGIPLFFFSLLLLLRMHTKRFRLLLISAVSLIGIASTPVALWINSLISTQGTVRIQLPILSNIIDLLIQPLRIGSRSTPLLDAVYTYASLWWIGFLVFAGIALFFIWREKKARPIVWCYGSVCALSALIASASGLLILSFLRFETLAVFEQYDYAYRLFQITELFLFPLAIFSLERLIAKIFNHKMIIFRITVILLLAGALTSSFYLSYPRNDAYVPSHAYTLSRTDITAVRTIDADAQGRDYGTLSNQVVASAAIREFGFKRYFTVPDYGEVFYYPIPSGSPLVPLYLAMLRSPSRDTAQEALNLLGIDRLYFVVRDYEFRFPIIVRDAKKTANEWYAIDDGKAFVFIYEKNR